MLLYTDLMLHNGFCLSTISLMCYILISQILDFLKLSFNILTILFKKAASNYYYKYFTNLQLFHGIYHCSTTHVCRWLLSSGTEDDLEYYVRDCGNILGVTQKLDSESQSAKHVLCFIFDWIVEFKKFNQVKLFSCLALKIVCQNSKY